MINTTLLIATICYMEPFKYIQIVYQSKKSKELNTVQKVELKPKEERKHTL